MEQIPCFLAITQNSQERYNFESMARSNILFIAAGREMVKLREGKISPDHFFRGCFDTEKRKDILHKEWSRSLCLRDCSYLLRVPGFITSCVSAFTPPSEVWWSYCPPLQSTTGPTALSSHSFFPRSNFSHANNFKRVRPEEASAQGILTQPSVNETAAKLMMRCGRKEQKVLQSVSATEGERRAESQKYLSRALPRA